MAKTAAQAFGLILVRLTRVLQAAPYVVHDF
jgi:hypothetical protein